MNDVSESMDGIADGTSFLLVQDGCDAETKKNNSRILTDIAVEFKNNKEKVIGNFFTVTGGGPVNFIKDECDIPKYIAKHEHELKKTEGENWGCDGCQNSGEECKERHRCNDCDFDFCETCLKKCEEPIPEEAKVPCMVLLNLETGKYSKPLEGSTDISRENILKTIDDYKNGKLTAKLLTSKAKGEV